MEALLTTDACTMPTPERPLRLAEFDELFAAAVRAVERRGTDVRMQFSGADGLADRVRDLTARETSCCSFFTFAIDGTDSDLRRRGSMRRSRVTDIQIMRPSPPGGPPGGLDVRRGAPFCPGLPDQGSE